MGYLLATMITLVAASPSPAEVRRAVETELSDPAYQRELPGVEAAREGFRRFPNERVLRRLADGSRGERVVAPPRVSSGARMVASATLWVLMLACGAVVLFIVGRAVFRPRKARVSGADQLTVHDNVIARPLDDAQQLAKLGRYADAIHTLLLRTLQELTRLAPEPVAESLTSREILQRVALPQPAHHALSGLIDAVEITHFGGREPDEDGYNHCLACFHEFARSYVETRT